ncbi:hypothetical protein HPO_05507 [Hyphomonas polymorpha PS728]|uniref:DUF4198 domain-containing protein n=1 Tax=Hyphomonas polymorpha PS728 TaxID=1280954 RepID=A0A062VMF2_9PROT|nr:MULTISPECIES: DUF4198 domain-containing protein [Hyphomonas]AXE64068.1 ABC transporter permease [Hyphomonas sp. CACIAM 19H1]KCZ99367.1 hypothetical protein HPO_05507 [Hyphomonas polymorpha PS728]
MKPTFLKACAVAALALTIASSASAHRAWMLPSSFTLSGENQWVTVDGAISNNLFYPNHHAMNLDTVTVFGPDGKPVEAQNKASGKYRSVFDVALEKEGTYRISSGGAGYMASWEEGGERKRWRGNAETLKSEAIEAKPGVQVSGNVRRIETFVTLGSPTTTVFATEGTGLELKPVTHPNDVFAGEEVTFQLLMDGKPAAGIEVDIIRGSDRYRNSEDGLKLTTDATGTIKFTPEEAGAYWLSTDSEGKGMLNGKEIQVRSSYVFTFEALPL